MAELKLTNNPCKYCNGEIDEGKPLCGDIVDKRELTASERTEALATIPDLPEGWMQQKHEWDACVA